MIAYVADPEGEGLVASLARPGGNITGAASSGIQLRTKLLQLIKELLPRASRIVIITERGNASTVPIVNELQETATPLGLTLLVAEVGDRDDLEKSVDAINARRPAGDMVLRVGARNCRLPTNDRTRRATSLA